jgi:hypothetical protein
VRLDSLKDGLSATRAQPPFPRGDAGLAGLRIESRQVFSRRLALELECRKSLPVGGEPAVRVDGGGAEAAKSRTTSPCVSRQRPMPS